MFTETWQPGTACEKAHFPVLILIIQSSRIDFHFVIKISDFGLSEDVFQRNYYREGVDGEMAKLPVKWMAPESLSDGHFSEKSDVVCQSRCREKERVCSVIFTSGHLE